MKKKIDRLAYDIGNSTMKYCKPDKIKEISLYKLMTFNLNSSMHTC